MTAKYLAQAFDQAGEEVARLTTTAASAEDARAELRRLLFAGAAETGAPVHQLALIVTKIYSDKPADKD
jgi:hypothetical protein